MVREKRICKREALDNWCVVKFCHKDYNRECGDKWDGCVPT